MKKIFKGYPIAGDNDYWGIVTIKYYVMRMKNLIWLNF